MSPRKSLASGAGFTLLELLVVMAIVAILGSLVTSALNQTKAKAHQVGCLMNLRQLQNAWTYYADENDDHLPLNRSIPSANEKIFGRRNAPGSWVTGNPKEDITTDNIEEGTLYRYLGSAKVYRCPGDASKVPVKKSVLRTRSYSMSAYLNGDELDVDPRVKFRMSQVQSQVPSKIFVFIEEDIHSPWLGSFSVMPRERTALASTAATASLAGSWHRGGADLSFVDGHVEFWRWQSDRRPRNGGAPVMLSHDIQDIRRLQEAIPRP